MFKIISASVVLLLLVNDVIVDGRRTFAIHLSNATWKVHSNKVDLNVTVKNDMLNMYFTPKVELTHPYARFEFVLQSSDSNQYDIALINRTVDLCKFFKNPLHEPLVQVVYKILLEHGDFIKTCPIKAKQYYAENVNIDAERFPPYMPERKGYTKTLFFIEDNNVMIPLSESTVHFEIKNSAVKRLKGVKAK